MIKRNIIAGLLTFYLGVAFLTGIIMGQAMPALNWKGQTYVGLTWPAAMFCHEVLNDHCTVVPPYRYSKYFFTFD